jgi:hypothetical protein
MQLYEARWSTNSPCQTRWWRRLRCPPTVDVVKRSQIRVNFLSRVGWAHEIWASFPSVELRIVWKFWCLVVTVLWHKLLIWVVQCMELDVYMNMCGPVNGARRIYEYGRPGGFRYSGRDKRCFSTPKRPDLFRGIPSFLSHRYPELFAQGWVKHKGKIHPKTGHKGLKGG